MQNAESHGLFDIRNFQRMDVVLCAGLGGGSLIYANVFMEPPDQVFDERWPANAKKAALAPYYRVAKEVLGSRPIPRNGDPRREIVRTRLFEKVAKTIGRDSQLVDINVFFGNDFADPLPIGEQAPQPLRRPPDLLRLLRRVRRRLQHPLEEHDRPQLPVRGRAALRRARC